MKPFKFLAAALALGLVGCPTDAPVPPDPNEPLPPVTCDDDGAPISLTRVAADSLLAVPGWIEVCTLCPASAITLTAEVPLLGGWTGDFGCAVAFPTVPPPAFGELEVEVLVEDGERTGAATLEIPTDEGRGPNPDDLGSATYRLQFGPDAQRIPVSSLYSALTPGDEGDLPEVLLHLGEPDESGGRVVTVGLTEAGETTQDLCAPTSQWSLPATLDQRHLVAVLAPGDRLPGPRGGPVVGGVLQASMRASGAALTGGAILSKLDLPAWEDELGLAPEELCDLFETFFGAAICVPCGDPSEGTAGLPTCVTAVQEFELAPATTEPLIPVSAEDLPPECLEA